MGSSAGVVRACAGRARVDGLWRREETAMDEATFNMSMRKYLKQVGVTSQQAIEKHVREHGGTSGRLKVRTVVSIEGHGMEHVVEGEVDLG